jgi:hypothetical protein
VILKINIEYNSFDLEKRVLGACITQRLVDAEGPPLLNCLLGYEKCNHTNTGNK